VHFLGHVAHVVQVQRVGTVLDQVGHIVHAVDHGTAKDIFGLNKANASSMMDAITWSIKLARQP
jgi:4-hydroxy-L-threonine phosphate dehydrogenase PdxA